MFWVQYEPVLIILTRPKFPDWFFVLATGKCAEAFAFRTARHVICGRFRSGATFS